MKKIIMLIILLLVLTGCGNIKTAKNDDKNKLFDKYLGIEYIEKWDLKLESLKKAKFLNHDSFVTYNNEVYTILLGKKTFEDGNKYKKYNLSNAKIVIPHDTEVETGEIVAIISESVMADEKTPAFTVIDNKTNEYYFTYAGETSVYYDGIRNMSYDLYEKLLKSNEWYANSNGYLHNSHNTWNYNVFYIDYEIKNYPSEENVISLNNNIVKTDKSYYYLKSKILNKNECKEYVDVECQTMYYMESINKLNNIYDKIVAATDWGEYFLVISNNGIIYKIKQ